MKESILTNYQEKPEKEKMLYFEVLATIKDPLAEDGDKEAERIMKKLLPAPSKEEAEERFKLLLVNNLSLKEKEIGQIKAREISEAEYWRTITKIKRSTESVNR